MRWFWQRADEPRRTDQASTNGSKASLPKQSTASLFSALTHLPTLASTAVLTSAILATAYVYRTRLRRIRNVAHLPPSLLSPDIYSHPHSLFGRIVTVPDGDGVRFYHTPCGRFALWSLLRRIPKHPFPRAQSGEQSFLSANTLSVRLSGVDAPEKAHFGNPEQPYAEEALEHLRGACLGRDVRLYPHSKDQYGRVVGTVLVRPWGGMGLGLPKRFQRDVGWELVNVGLATVYEGKYGVEFGGHRREGLLRETEEQAQKNHLGMWKDRGRRSGLKGGQGQSGEDGMFMGTLRSLWRKIRGTRPDKVKTKIETPREYKTRTAKEARAEENTPKR